MSKENTNAEVIAEWNSIIPFKIKETDLVKPTEQFLFQALLNYIKMMNMSIKKFANTYDETKETMAKNKVKLCAYVNYLYQKTDPKHSFVYIDLLHPTPKKTVHLLKILINYMLYTNMVKEQVIKNANEVLDERKMVLDKFDDQVNIEKQLKNEEAEISQSIKELPKARKQLVALQKRESKLIEEYSNEKSKYQMQNMDVMKKHDEVYNLQSQIVTDIEAEHLNTNVENIQAELEEQAQILLQTKENCLEYSKNVTILERCIKKIKSILEETNNVDEANAVSAKIEDLSVSIQKIEKLIETDKSKTTFITEDLKKMETVITDDTKKKVNLQKKLKKEKQRLQKKITKLENALRLVNDDNVEIVRHTSTEQVEINFIIDLAKSVAAEYLN